MKRVISETDYLREKTRLMCIIAEKDRIIKMQINNNKVLNQRNKNLEEKCIKFQKELNMIKGQKSKKK